MIDILISIIILLCVGLAVFYIYKEKKKGTACIGCPYAGSCQKHKAGISCQHPGQTGAPEIKEK